MTLLSRFNVYISILGILFFIYLYSCLSYIEMYEMYSDIIPKVVHQTYSSFDNLPECVKRVIEENKRISPSYTFKFYNDDDVDRYIQNHFNADIYDAFKKLNPRCGACKADFFRYAVLYKEGGVYADVKTKFNVDLDDWIHSNKKLKFTLWPWYNHNKLDKFYLADHKPKSQKREINQAVLFFPAKHPLIKEVIDEMVTIIEKEHKLKDVDKVKSVLEITGPHLFTKVVAPKLNNYDYDMMDNGENLYDGKVIYDGTAGCYHAMQRQQNLRYSKIKPIVL